MNPRRFWHWLTLGVALALLLGALPASANTPVPPTGVQTAPTATPPPPGAVVINFDDVGAPCSFGETVALRDQYAAQGVLFMGPAPLDGGGILDQCSNFGVSGYSPPNFLAFNQNSNFSDGGIPRPPEIITFTNGAGYVQVNAGSGSGAGQIVTMEAFDAAGSSLGSDSLTLAPTLDTLSITATGIAYVVIDGPAVFVLDDLAFLESLGEPDIVVEPLSLQAALCPDTTTAQDLLICEVAGRPLDWSIVEETRTVVLAPTSAGSLPARPVELALAAVPASSVAARPWQPDGPVNLILDDGSPENYIGLNDGISGYQLLWLNRFTPNPADFPFQLETISVLFGSTNVPLGGPVDLVVYEDTDGDGDPSNATVVAVYNETVLANDGVTWSDYTLATPLVLNGPGDVLIGAINRYQESGVEPADFPAALDQTATQQRSWVGSWSTDPPAPPVLPPDSLWDIIDAFGFAGNWMIRGSGETGGPPPADVPWLSEDPISGTVAAGGCQTVTVTFDATGLTPGDYLANLLIDSNDPDEPVVTVPVTMTVLEPVDLVDVSYITAGLQVTFDAVATGSEPISYLWDFGDGITSTLEDPVHTYDQGGCYDVALDVENACGTDTWTGQVCVAQYRHLYLPLIFNGFDAAP